MANRDDGGSKRPSSREGKKPCKQDEEKPDPSPSEFSGFGRLVRNPGYGGFEFPNVAPVTGYICKLDPTVEEPPQDPDSINTRIKSGRHASTSTSKSKEDDLSEQSSEDDESHSSRRSAEAATAGSASGAGSGKQDGGCATTAGSASGAGSGKQDGGSTSELKTSTNDNADADKNTKKGGS